MKVINWRIAGNPYNWVKVNLMAITAMLGVYLLLDLAAAKDGAAKQD